MSQQANTIERLRAILVKMNVYPDVENLKSAENLFSAGAVDSLILIQFVLAIEDEFKIRLSNEDINYDQFQSLEKIAALLAGKYSK